MGHSCTSKPYGKVGGIYDIAGVKCLISGVRYIVVLVLFPESLNQRGNWEIRRGFSIHISAAAVFLYL